MSSPGPRGRSKFIEEAVRTKVQHEKLGIALKKYAGILKPEDHPEWSTPAKTSEWVWRGRDLDRGPVREFYTRQVSGEYTGNHENAH